MDASDIAKAYAAAYSDDPQSGRESNALLALRDGMPQMAPLPDRRPSLKPYQRPGDPMLGQNLNEATAARLGDSLAQRNWGDAILTAAELAVGAFPGAKGARRGQAGSTGQAGRPAGAGAEAGGVRERGGLPGGDRGVPAPGGAEHQYTSIPGQPRTVKLPGAGEVEARPIPQIEAAARAYAESKGRPYEVAASFEPLDVERSQRIAAAYEAMQHDPHNADVKRAYDAMIEETLGQYRELKSKGFEFKFNEPGQDPYAKSPALGYLDMRDRGQLSVFPTVEGHGSKGAMITPEEVRNNPLLQESGEQFAGKPALMNDLFRAVHDAYGHHGPGNAFFRGPGEDRAFGHHSILYGAEALKGITPELRGQNSWLNYGPHAEFNKGKSGAETMYADQKVGILPEWTWQEGLPVRKRGGE